MDKRAQAEGVELEGVELPGRKHGQPDALGRFDDGGGCPGLEPPDGFAGLPGGVEGLYGTFAGRVQLAEDFAEAVPAVAHGKELQGVVRPDASPTAGDGVGGGGGGESSLEFVRSDQDPLAHGSERSVRPNPSARDKVKSGTQTPFRIPPEGGLSTKSVKPEQDGRNTVAKLLRQPRPWSRSALNWPISPSA